MWTGDGLPGDELYSMDVEEASKRHAHLRSKFDVFVFCKLIFPADEEALAVLPNRIFIGLTDKGADRNYLVFRNSPPGRHRAG